MQSFCNIKLLAVDDDHINTCILSMLSDQLDITIDVYNTPSEVINHLCDYNGIIINVNGGMTGIEIAKEIKKIDPCYPIIFRSYELPNADIQEMEQYGTYIPHCDNDPIKQFSKFTTMELVNRVPENII